MRWEVGVGLTIVVLVLIALFLPLCGNTGVKENIISRSLRVQQPTELWNYTCGNDIKDIAVSEDGNYIAVASKDGKLYFFKQDGTLLWTKNFGSEYPTSVAISEYGTYIFVGAGTTVYLYNNAGTDLGSFDTTGDVYYVDITPDGKYAVSFGYYVDFFNLTGGNMPSLYQWYASPPYSPIYGKISNDGSYVFASPANGHYYYSGEGVILYEGKGYTPITPRLSPNTPLWTFTDPANGDIYDADMSDDGTYIVVGTYNNRVHLLNNDGSIKWTYIGNDHVYSVSISYDNQYVAAVIYETLYTFSTSSSTPLWKDTNGPGNDYGWYDRITFVKDDDIIAAYGYSSNYTHGIYYYSWAKDINNNTFWACTYEYRWDFFSSQSYSRFGKAISGDGQYFAGAGSYDFKVHFLGPPYVPEFPDFVSLIPILLMAPAVVYIHRKKR